MPLAIKEGEIHLSNKWDYNSNIIHKTHRLQRKSYGRPPIPLFTDFLCSNLCLLSFKVSWLWTGEKVLLLDEVTSNKIYFNENLAEYYIGVLCTCTR
ncbi:hypothetical protein J6590_035851 [Homalodisca vitripennis]|nr:hypothetical protein J6590_035851 [Homalodisca vitripennis]